MSVVKQTKEGLFYRTDTADRNMLKDSDIGKPGSDYETVNPTGKVIMDVGANIGGFSVRAIKLGAKHITCYEPLPSNIEILRMNLEGLPVESIEKCVLGDDTPEVTFYQNASKLSHCSASIKAKKKATEYQVPAINFWSEVDRIKPDLIKMDIEGAEYQILLDKKLPEFVKELMIEIHQTNINYREKAELLIASLKQQFSEVLFDKQEIVFNRVAATKMHFKR
jgi:FkbM family methyltransferase